MTNETIHFQINMEFKTRVKNESDIEVWEMSEAYDVSVINPQLTFHYQCYVFLTVSVK